MNIPGEVQSHTSEHCSGLDPRACLSYVGETLALSRCGLAVPLTHAGVWPQGGWNLFQLFI